MPGAGLPARRPAGISGRGLKKGMTPRQESSLFLIKNPGSYLKMFRMLDTELAIVVAFSRAAAPLAAAFSVLL